MAARCSHTRAAPTRDAQAGQRQRLQAAGGRYPAQGAAGCAAPSSSLPQREPKPQASRPPLVSRFSLAWAYTRLWMTLSWVGMGLRAVHGRVGTPRICAHVCTGARATLNPIALSHIETQTQNQNQDSNPTQTQVRTATTGRPWRR